MNSSRLLAIVLFLLALTGCSVDDKEHSRHYELHFSYQQTQGEDSILVDLEVDAWRIEGGYYAPDTTSLIEFNRVPLFLLEPGIYNLFAPMRVHPINGYNLEIDDFENLEFNRRARHELPGITGFPPDGIVQSGEILRLCWENTNVYPADSPLRHSSFLRVTLSDDTTWTVDRPGSESCYEFVMPQVTAETCFELVASFDSRVRDELRFQDLEVGTLHSCNWSARGLLQP